MGINKSLEKKLILFYRHKIPEGHVQKNAGNGNQKYNQATYPTVAGDHGFTLHNRYTGKDTEKLDEQY